MVWKLVFHQFIDTPDSLYRDKEGKEIRVYQCEDTGKKVKYINGVKQPPTRGDQGMGKFIQISCSSSNVYALDDKGNVFKWKDCIRFTGWLKLDEENEQEEYKGNDQ